MPETQGNKRLQNHNFVTTNGILCTTDQRGTKELTIEKETAMYNKDSTTHVPD
jgi:hypothetical protein